MSVIIDKDCIVRPDGKLLCWDKDDCKLYLLTKETLTPDKVTDDELARLVRKTWKP